MGTFRTKTFNAMSGKGFVYKDLSMLDAYKNRWNFRLTSLGDRAFADCKALAGISIPSGIDTVGDDIFAGCNAIQRVYFAGNAPDIEPFNIPDNSAEFYFRPGATGWSPTYNGRPATLWNPVFQSLVVSDGTISCTVTGNVGIPIALEVSTNLLSGQWTRIETTSLAGGSVSFNDLGTDVHSHFYRIVGP